MVFFSLKCCKKDGFGSVTYSVPGRQVTRYFCEELAVKKLWTVQNLKKKKRFTVEMKKCD